MFSISKDFRELIVKTYGSVDKARKHFRLKWLEALESGRYKQAQGQLREAKMDKKSYGYCCLGVLSNLAAKDGVGEWEPSYGGECRYFVLDGHTDDMNIVEPLAYVVGLPTKLRDRLVTMNDDEDKSFKEIAAHLRKVWRLPKKK